MELYVTRHAKSLSNEKEIAASISEEYCGGLSKLGKQQAKELIPKLQKHKFDTIIVSPLSRTIQTVQPYLDSLKILPKILTLKLVLERDLGDLIGLSIKEVREIKAKTREDPVKWIPTKGESILDVQKRAKEFVNYLKKNFNEDSKILLCGHSVFLRALDIILNKGDILKFYNYPEPQYGVLRKYSI